MKRSTDRILTTHVGSLPRPNDLMALYAQDAPDTEPLPRLNSEVGAVDRWWCFILKVSTRASPTGVR